MDNNSVKGNIRKFRKEAGITQSEMAVELGMSRMGYINIEKEGRTALLNEDLERIAHRLGRSMEELVLGNKVLGEKDGPGYGSSAIALKEMEEKIEMYLAIIQEQNKMIEEQKKMLAQKESMIAQLKKKI